MTASLAVSDASPLITFHQFDRLHLLRSVFPDIIVPPAVAREVAPSLGVLPPWISERRPISIPQSVMSLDAGERESIALALSLSAKAVILDDLAARKNAAQLGLTVVGWVGILPEARRQGSIDLVRPDLDAMIANGLYVGGALYREALDIAGEAGS